MPRAKPLAGPVELEPGCLLLQTCGTWATGARAEVTGLRRTLSPTVRRAGWRHLSVAARKATHGWSPPDTTDQTARRLVNWLALSVAVAVGRRIRTTAEHTKPYPNRGSTSPLSVAERTRSRLCLPDVTSTCTCCTSGSLLDPRIRPSTLFSVVGGPVGSAERGSRSPGQCSQNVGFKSPLEHLHSLSKGSEPPSGYASFMNSFWTSSRA